MATENFYHNTEHRARIIRKKKHNNQHTLLVERQFYSLNIYMEYIRIFSEHSIIKYKLSEIRWNEPIYTSQHTLYSQPTIQNHFHIQHFQTHTLSWSKLVNIRVHIYRKLNVYSRRLSVHVEVRRILMKKAQTPH